MITWNDIPASAKLSAGVVVAVFSLMGYLTTYQTDVEAQTYQLQHESELVRNRVSEIERDISSLRYRLLSEKLSDEQRQFLDGEVQRLEAEKQCIIERKC